MPTHHKDRYMPARHFMAGGLKFSIYTKAS